MAEVSFVDAKIRPLMTASMMEEDIRLGIIYRLYQSFLDWIPEVYIVVYTSAIEYFLLSVIYIITAVYIDMSGELVLSYSLTRQDLRLCCYHIIGSLLFETSY